MESQRFAGPLLRLLRLQQNWSQETLCGGICAVSYLSKIEQGKADANTQLLMELFERLGVVWQESAEITALRDDLYEGIFSWDGGFIDSKMKELEKNWPQCAIGPCYADFVVIRAYYYRKPDSVPQELEPLLNSRQRALYAIMQNRHEEAYRVYPCPLTAFCVAEEAYRKGNYTLSLEYLQIAFEQAARDGYVYLMMNCQAYMANCYTDIGNLDAMERHSRIAARLGRALGEDGVVKVIDYNIAATKVECGDFESAFAYFSALDDYSVMDLHKLAICCEVLGKPKQALIALNHADEIGYDDQLEADICMLVRYRLEHPDYLNDEVYGALLMETFRRIQSERHFGFARFHLRWVTQWLTANRQYRQAFELLKNFPNHSL